jgi:activating signal cointegrator complex subunit 1
MHSPKSTSILYAGPQDPSGRLFQACVALRGFFEKEGCLVPDNRPLKLHATIVNNIYAKSGHRGGENLRIDAENLLEEWKDFVWAQDFVIEKLAICKMGAKKTINESGQVIGEEYEEVASIPFPA